MDNFNEYYSSQSLGGSDLISHSGSPILAGKTGISESSTPKEIAEFITSKIISVIKGEDQPPVTSDNVDIYLSPMDKLTQGYEKFIQGEELTKNSKQVFDRAIKKASKPKQRGSK